MHPFDMPPHEAPPSNWFWGLATCVVILLLLVGGAALDRDDCDALREAAAQADEAEARLREAEEAAWRQRLAEAYQAGLNEGVKATKGTPGGIALVQACRAVESTR